MDRLLSAADKALSLLPFNGDKTVISMGLKFLMPIVVSHVPILLPLAPAIDASLDAILAIALAHKAIKAKKPQ